MQIAWFQDPPYGGVFGGAELSGLTLAGAAPAGIDVKFCSAYEAPTWADAVVIQNSVALPAGAALSKVLATRPVIKSVRDYGVAGDPRLAAWLLRNAKLLTFNSAPHLDEFPHEIDSNVRVELVPPPVDVARFRDAVPAVDTDAEVVWVGNMAGLHKGLDRAVDWATANETRVDFYGAGTFHKMITGEWARYCGQADYARMPGVYASYRRLLYLPRWTEPFGRVIMEADTAGLDLSLVEGEIGYLWWKRERPADLDQGVDLFWEAVLEVV